MTEAVPTPSLAALQASTEGLFAATLQNKNGKMGSMEKWNGKMGSDPFMPLYTQIGVLT